MSKRRTLLKKRVPKHVACKADDSFSIGPIRVTRSGNSVFIQKSSSEEEQRRMIESLAAKQPDIVRSLDALALEIKNIVSNIDPIEAMHRAFWDYAGDVCAGPDKNKSYSGTTHSKCFLAYLQAAIVSVSNAEPDIKECADATWERLREAVAELYDTIASLYLISVTAEKMSSREYDESLEDFSIRAQLDWLWVAGERYPNHAAEHAAQILGPQSEILERTLGVSANQIVQAVQDLLDSLTRKPVRSTLRFVELRDEILNIIGNKCTTGDIQSPDVHAAIEQAIEKTGLKEELASAAEDAVGLGLFEVVKATGLPESIVELLSLAPGAAVGVGGLFDPGRYCGWPLRLFPTWNKPFVSYGGKYFLFDAYGLDRIHFHLAKIVRERFPNERNRWNEIQKEISERVPLEMLSSLLATPNVIGPVYYKWIPMDGAADKDWCECDGLVMYDDWLFVIEIKSGTYAYTSPSLDLNAHVDSVKNLLLEPTRQGQRFLEYLYSQSEVSICDSSHAEMRKLKAKDFRKIVPCSITWDQLTSIATSIQFNGKFSSGMGSTPVWCVSVDDLRVLAEVFRTPVEFTHYLCERLRAYEHEAFRASSGVDEIDHLGLYFARGGYTKWLGKIQMGNSLNMVHPNGFGKLIDEYFEKKLLGEYAEVPSQNIPPVLRGIIERMSTSPRTGRTRAAHAILDLDGDSRARLEAQIQQELTNQVALRRPRLATIVPQALSFACNVGVFGGDCTHRLCWETALSARISGHDEQVLLLLVAKEDGTLDSVDFEIVRLDQIAEGKKQMLDEEAQTLARNRVGGHIKRHGEVFRNDPCPCGSGKKYKQCCMNRMT